MGLRQIFLTDGLNFVSVNTSLRVDNPEEADFFIVSFTLICLSFVGFNRKNIELNLKKLKYYNNGYNHIVLI